MKLKYWQNIFYAIVNANSVVEHVNQNKYGIMLNVNLNAKSISQVLCQQISINKKWNIKWIVVFCKCFISGNVTIYNGHYLLSLCKT